MSDTQAKSTTLYHYCSNEAFVSIVTSKQIWLSLLSLSNDSMEGKWVRKFFVEACKAEGLGALEEQSLLSKVDTFIDMTEALGFCMSADGDVLSQWRAYAGNGGGVAIGFDPSAFDRLSEYYRANRAIGFFLSKVDYTLTSQRKQIEAALDKIMQGAKDGVLRPFLGTILTGDPTPEQETEYWGKYNKWLKNFLFLLPNLHTMKNPAFKEEQESRLIAVLPILKDQTNDLAQNCKFRAVGHNRVVPYWPVELLAVSGPTIIEVVLGPRNETPIKFVRTLLESNDFKNVSIRTSEASYR